MYPYRLNEENYFRTGFVAEGITTYLGEYFLRQSGFFSEERLLLEIEQWLNRHLMHRGLKRASLSESSFDLWVDGYISQGADYKVSIYVAGALSAIALDLHIRLYNSAQSIFDLMRILYQEKALQHEGYTEAYLASVIEHLMGEEGKVFWEHCITGSSVDTYALQALEQFGISALQKPSLYLHESVLGIKLKQSAGKLEIAKVHITAPAAACLIMDDVILAVNKTSILSIEELEEAMNNSTTWELLIKRKGREKTYTLMPATGNYWSSYSLQKNSEASDEQKLRYKDWMNGID
jgi:predicted metalloprotease with PDZ domain